MQVAGWKLEVGGWKLEVVCYRFGALWVSRGGRGEHVEGAEDYYCLLLLFIAIVYCLLLLFIFWERVNSLIRDLVCCRLQVTGCRFVFGIRNSIFDIRYSIFDIRLSVPEVNSGQVPDVKSGQVPDVKSGQVICSRFCLCSLFSILYSFGYFLIYNR